MDLGRALFQGLRAYFWLLVVLSVLTLAWTANRFLIDGDALGVGWLAVAGFGVLIVVFLLVIRRVAY